VTKSDADVSSRMFANSSEPSLPAIESQLLVCSSFLLHVCENKRSDNTSPILLGIKFNVVVKQILVIIDIAFKQSVRFSFVHVQ